MIYTMEMFFGISLIYNGLTEVAFCKGEYLFSFSHLQVESFFLLPNPRDLWNTFLTFETLCLRYLVSYKAKCYM